MSNGIRWTQEDYERYLARNNRAAVCSANSKSTRRNEAAPAVKAQEVYSRVRIHIHHRTRRLSDATGRSHKACVDGLVRSGILKDDSPKFVKEISETYELAETEETIIEIYEIEPLPL